MAVICRSHFVSQEIEKRLKQDGIQFNSARDSASKHVLFDETPAVKLVSMHSSKGLEFGTVFIPGLGYMPDSHGTEENAARLLYVAMTRATERVVMTHHKASPFTGRVRAAIEDVGQRL